MQCSELSFSRNVAVRLRNLNKKYLDCMKCGDDDGVARFSREFQTIEHAAAAYSSAQALTSVGVRSQKTAKDPVAEEARNYLIGIQERLAEALLNDDFDALRRVSDAAEAAIQNLTHPNQTFRGVKTDTGDTEISENELQSVRLMSLFTNLSVEQEAEMESIEEKTGLRGLNELSSQDKIILLLYFVMLIGFLIAGCMITQNYIHSLQHPDSFMGVKMHESLPMPVVTLCLSRPGLPHSRLQVFDFIDSHGRQYREKSEYLQYLSRPFNDSDRVIERFWDNPDNENCDRLVGDFFPFPSEHLSGLANGSLKTSCKPCYRFGRLVPTVSRSNAPMNSSLISVLTDHYAMECFQRPGGLTFHSMDYLHDVAYNNIQSNDPTLTRFNILDRFDKADMKATMTDDDFFEQLSGQQLCNLFYFALFPKLAGRIPANDTSIKYSFNGSEWFFTGTGREFVPPKRGKFVSDLAPLEIIEMYISHNASAGKRVGLNDSDMVHIGPNSQNFVSLRDVKVYQHPQFDVQTSSSNFVATDVVEMFGFWLNCRVFYNYNRLITELYYRESTYPFWQYLVDFFGYLAMFTGASVFSVLLLPVLHGVQKRRRARMKAERPEAYLLRKVRKHGILHANARDDILDEEPLRNIKLPGYNV